MNTSLLYINYRIEVSNVDNRVIFRKVENVLLPSVLSLHRVHSDVIQITTRWRLVGLLIALWSIQNTVPCGQLLCHPKIYDAKVGTSRWCWLWDWNHSYINGCERREGYTPTRRPQTAKRSWRYCKVGVRNKEIKDNNASQRQFKVKTTYFKIGPLLCMHCGTEHLGTELFPLAFRTLKHRVNAPKHCWPIATSNTVGPNMLGLTIVLGVVASRKMLLFSHKRDEQFSRSKTVGQPAINRSTSKMIQSEIAHWMHLWWMLQNHFWSHRTAKLHN